MDKTKKRVGIMGGTFDPVHNAHLTLAKRAYEQFSLDEIWMLPNGNPPHKKNTRQADVECRMQMIRLAIQGIPYLKLCDEERSGGEFHYTCETLGRLREEHPDTVFYFIMGADSLFEFDRWREPELISRECILLAAVRDHCRREEIRKRVEELKDRFGAEIYILDTPNMDISSVDIRELISQNRDISYMVPPVVEEYIRGQGLYEAKQEDE